MEKKKIYLDDWNTVFRSIPKSINDKTYDILCGTNNCVDLSNYSVLKDKLQLIMNDIGRFDYISHVTGDQTIINAIKLCNKYLDIQYIYVVKNVFHGITIKWLRDENLCLENFDIIEIDMDSMELEISRCHDNSLLILEPFLFYAKYGDFGIEKIKSIVYSAKIKKMKVLFDEIRSGVFCSGEFLFTQKCLPVDVDFICFSKGLALGIPTSVLAMKTGLLPIREIKKEDRLKSCMAISEIAMQRSCDLLDYYLNNREHFSVAIADINNKLNVYLRTLERYDLIQQVNNMGLCCIVVFKGNIQSVKLRLLWTYLISKKIEVRNNEGNLWFFNFALDSTDDEILRLKDAIEEAMKLVK